MSKHPDMDLRRRAASKERWGLRYQRVRREAVNALGGVCPQCLIERDPAFLYIEALSEIAKCWSQVLFYRRVADDPSIARLICGNCRSNERSAKWMKEKMDKVASRENGTGMFYWVGGQRIEQLKRKAPGALVKTLYYDIGVEELECP